MITRFLLQHTRRAVQPGEVVPDEDWHTVSRHSSQRAAERAHGNVLGRMAERCGVDWDDSYRVTPTRDVDITFTAECNGYVNHMTGGHVDCCTSERETVVMRWKAKTNMPAPVFTEWARDERQCEYCQMKEKATRHRASQKVGTLMFRMETGR